jgi:riboflavin kinase/FMN adenylyltransferase
MSVAPDSAAHVRTARALTAPQFALRGGVEHGDQRGRTIGFPTANLAVENLPELDGVWAGWLDLRGSTHAAAISVGTRPTFYGPHGFRLLEAHILDYSGDCYGQVVTVWMCELLRDQVKFESVDHLVGQLDLDVAAVREWSTDATVPTEPGIYPALRSLPFGRPIPLSSAA